MKTQPTILVADHRGEGLRERCEALAAVGFHAVASSGLSETLATIAAEAPDAVLIEPLAREGRVELAAISASRGTARPLPLLVACTPERRPGILRTLLELGGAPRDLVDAGADADELRLRLGRLLDESARTAEMAELRHRAQHDDRTDLLRPLAFKARLDEHFSAAQRHRLSLALALIDLDDFGLVNKHHDHTVGDLIIERAGEAIRRTLRTEDVAGRLGGDEFAVLLPYTKKVDAARVVNRLVEAIHDLSGPFPGARHDVRVAASVGFETTDGTDVTASDQLRDHAERALRAAKVAGGNRGVYYRNLESGE